MYKVERKLGTDGVFEMLEDNISDMQKAATRCLELIKIHHTDWHLYIPKEFAGIRAAKVDKYFYKVTQTNL
jgi:hypothetical protein